MSEYYKSRNDVSVTFVEPSNTKPYAKVKTYAYPDGMTKANGLDPDELRDIAEMLHEAANDLEAKNNDR